MMLIFLMSFFTNPDRFIFWFTYTVFDRFHSSHLFGIFNIIRAKSNLKFRLLYSYRVNKKTRLKYDGSIVLSNYYAHKDNPEKLHRNKFFDADNQRDPVFLSNMFILAIPVIAKLYKQSLNIEIFFKGIT